MDDLEQRFRNGEISFIEGGVDTTPRGTRIIRHRRRQSALTKTSNVHRKNSSIGISTRSPVTSKRSYMELDEDMDTHMSSRSNPGRFASFSKSPHRK